MDSSIRTPRNSLKHSTKQMTRPSEVQRKESRNSDIFSLRLDLEVLESTLLGTCYWVWEEMKERSSRLQKAGEERRTMRIRRRKIL